MHYRNGKVEVYVVLYGLSIHKTTLLDQIHHRTIFPLHRRMGGDIGEGVPSVISSGPGN